MFTQFFRLSNCYFWYFAVLGLIVPFFGIYLDYLQFSSREIGEVLAVVTATKIFGPSLWAMMADKTGKLLPIIQRGALWAFICFCALFWLSGFWAVTIALTAFSLFYNAILPQIEVVSLASINRSPKFYGRIRLWGSIGFIVIAMATGQLIESYSAAVFVPVGAFVLLLLWLTTLWIEAPVIKKASIEEESNLWPKICHLGFILFFIAGLLLQVSFGPYYSFFGLYVLQLDYPGIAVGGFMVIGVIAEVGIFIAAGKIFKHSSIKQLLVISLLLTALRWYLTAISADSLILLALAQVLHAAGFGLYHSASMQFIQRHFAQNQQNRGQAIYISGVYGVGGALGAYLAGIYWLDGQGAEHSFTLAAIASLIAAALALLIPKQKNTGQ